MTRGTEGSIFDAAVVGAGPAGSATARWLAQQGCRVALLERTRFEAPRIGESLAPNVQGPLRELGLWSEFLALAPLRSWGTRSLWGDASPKSHSHLFNPYGYGWHVDRQAFDRMLASGAAASGATFFEGTALRRSTYEHGFWRLQVTSDSSQTAAMGPHLAARVLIDATGRRAQVARALGGTRVVLDRLVGVAVRWTGVDAREQEHLLVEAVRDGWWYSAPLPSTSRREGDAMIAVMMTDADLCARLRLTATQRWQSILDSTQATKERLGTARMISPPQVHYANSHRLRRDGSRDIGPWLAVGDAALAVDPISGSGVPRALSTARVAAEAVGELLARPGSWQPKLADYEGRRDAECTSYLLERLQYYAAEQRFDTPFWHRRHLARRNANEAADTARSFAAA